MYPCRGSRTAVLMGYDLVFAKMEICFLLHRPLQKYNCDYNETQSQKINVADYRV